ncbi:piggyBac transposable element-derived protein 2-like [Rhagoletis pomonella]|uniref:piggyBac transposable element-derived protein 2-like n=1 Tax=Rhagoletis pomonella TaxID=28610 RepID=UPI00177BFEAC|nr:piggyBac transposable element-derived protein 2-like [Rhagoletis pomonella]
MAKKNLSDKEIENLLMYEEIPSDTDSFAGGDGSDRDQSKIEEIPQGEQQLLLGEDLFRSDEEFDSEDEVPLSQLLGRIQPATQAVPLLAQTVRPPKWKKAYTILAPDNFTPSSNLPDETTSLAASQQMTTLKIFNMLWTDDIMQHVTFHTNLYAEQKGGTYKPVAADEMSVFIAVNLVMGVKKSPSYRDYWSSSPDLRDEYISHFMSLSRFSWILGNLHLNDNNLLPSRNNPDYDKLYKIRPFTEMLRESYKKNYNHTEKIAIDESMIKFKGRSCLKQYMPKKPIKRGYKVWAKCASSGYCLDFDIYSGKVGNKVETNLGGNVVRKFCEGLEDKNHKVYFDNYFNSYELQVDLRQKNIYACGTVNESRKHLPTLKSDKSESVTIRWFPL